MAARGAECCGFCVRVHVGVQVCVHRFACGCAARDSQHPLPHSAALSAFPFKYHPPTAPPQTPGEIVPPPDEVTHANEQ